MATLEEKRHSLAHLLAMAVLKHDPKAKLAIGPAIDTGFYYDIEFSPEKTPSPEVLPTLEKEMRALLHQKLQFERREVTASEARAQFEANPFKRELIDDLEKQGETISLYTTGNFVDLCRGGHVENTTDIETKSFTLSHLAGAYWRGDEKNKMLTRIYGLAFETEDLLKNYLIQQEEAKKRDHRKIAKEQDLLVFSDLVGTGMPMFTPKGNIIRNGIIDFSRELNRELGFQEVHTPNVNKAELFKISGHYEKYKDDLLTVHSQYSEEGFFLKPMNCPQHTQIYASRPRSYRDLPIRYSDFANLYRDERPGELSGLTRLRSFAQDDGHTFCTQDQIEGEISSILGAIQKALATYKIDYWMRLSLRDITNKEKYLGEDFIWEQAEMIMRKLLQDKSITFREAAGEAAFYGPKIDIMAVDALGREWQISTIQLDFNQPNRFGLTYVDTDGTSKTPVMIHRALVGSPDRFMGILIEHYAGAFPLWLSPVQVKILPISEKHREYGHQILAALQQTGIRAELDDSDESLGKKVRNAKTEKVPYFVVLGDKEMNDQTVSLESRTEKVGVISVEALVKKLQEEITSKK